MSEAAGPTLPTPEATGEPPVASSGNPPSASLSDAPLGSPSPSRAVVVAFWLYAMVLAVGVRTAAHHAFTGWVAKLVTMGGIALGRLPWGRWLQPRIAWVLGLFGRAILLACYAVFLMPIAALMRLRGDALKTARPAGGSSHWLARTPRTNTLNEARVEY